MVHYECRWDDHSQWEATEIGAYPLAKGQKMQDLPDDLQEDRLEAWNDFLAGQHKSALIID